MADQIEEIKRKVGIASVVSEYVNLKRSGRNLKGLCPFHEEKTPSFMVNEELSIYKCFGCGEGGDIFNFLMKIDGLEFGEALEKLAEKAGVKLERVFDTQEKSEKTKLLEINSLAAEYYHYLLTEHSAGEVAREYLKGRGVGEKLIKTFKLGFALDEWEGLITYLVKKKKQSKELLFKTGLMLESKQGGYDRFRGRIVFPFTDVAGRVVGFSGRIVPALAKGDDGGAKYINSPETPVYHKSRVFFGLTQARQAIRKTNRVVVVEGPMDMISSFAAGVTETVAINGTALTEEMVVILRRLCDRAVLGLDADSAGEMAIKRSIEEAEKEGLDIRVVNISGGKDPDEVARKSPQEWKKQVEGAVEIYDFVMERSLARWGSTGGEGARKITEEVLPYLIKIGNSVVQSHYVRKLAGSLGVGEENVWEEMEKLKRQEGVGSKALAEEIVPTKMSRLSILGRQLLGLLMASDEKGLEQVKKMLSGLSLEGSWGKLVVWILERGKVGKIKNFIEEIPKELKGVAEEAYLLGVDEERVERELVKTAEEIVKEVTRQELEKITEEIKKAEAKNDKKRVSQLSKRFTSLSWRRS